MTIYITEEWKGNGKQNYCWNEYRQDGDRITKYACNRFKHFDGDENEWVESEEEVESWDKDDENIPEWLEQYIVRNSEVEE